MGAGDPGVFRANLMQLGVLFKGRLHAKLHFRFGPFWSSSCRLADLNDMFVMKVSNARAVSH
jgi:hypothetical protein